ncbi:MAG TPA: hypothetical protein VF520_02500 [Thermoleophilaceae bacterium]|jgi:hypothetical protein
MPPAYSDKDPALQAALAKADRAVEHLKTLETRVGKFLDRKPYRVIFDFEPETGWHVGYLRVLEEPPVSLSVIVGEIAYQQLSALNLLTFELAKRHLGREPTKKDARDIQFPVAQSPDDFRSRAVIRKRLVSQDTAADFEDLQPYKGLHGPKGSGQHSLPLIKEIADSDKHQDIVAGFSKVTFEGIRVEWDTEVAWGLIYEPLTPADGYLENGTKVARVRFEVGNPQANVRVDRQPAAEILFRTRSWSIRLRDLEYALSWTAGALDELERTLLIATLPARRPEERPWRTHY